MWIVEMKANPDGSHNDNRADHITEVPVGWAMIPDDFHIPSTFPFVSVEAEEITYTRKVDVEGEDGEIITEYVPYSIMTVTAMTEGVVPPAPERTPTAEEDTAAMLVDHEFRLTLLELGLF